jgi:hypothetical protein
MDTLIELLPTHGIIHYVVYYSPPVVDIRVSLGCMKSKTYTYTMDQIDCALEMYSQPKTIKKRNHTKTLYSNLKLLYDMKADQVCLQYKYGN